MLKAARDTHEQAAAEIEAPMEFTVVPPSIEEALAHGAQVERFAAILFDALVPLHGLSAPWDEILKTAARLHDIGWLYGQKKHHKNSASMIRSGLITEVPAELRNLVALVARYHRRSDPSPRQKDFAALPKTDRRAVARMAALLRLADALNYSHNSLVQNISVNIEEKAVCIVLDCPEGCPAEIARVQDKCALFTRIFKRKILCQCL